MMSRALYACVAVLVCIGSCTRPPVSRGPCKPVWPAGGVSTLDSLSQGAELVVYAAGRRLSFEIYARAGADGGVFADVYGPMGAPAVSLEVTPGGEGFISIGALRLGVEKTQKLSSIVDFFDSPFTFGDFVRILDGTLVSNWRPEGEPDSVVDSGTVVRRIWNIDSTRVEFELSGDGCEAKAIRVSPLPRESWKLEFSRFSSYGAPSQTMFKADEKNYFVLTVRTKRQGR